MKRLLKRIGPAVLGVAIVVAVFGFALGSPATATSSSRLGSVGVGDRRASRRSDMEHPHLRAPVARCDALRPVAGARRDAGLDGGCERLSGRRGGRCRPHLRDAERLGLRSNRDRRSGRGRVGAQPAREGAPAGRGARSSLRAVREVCFHSHSSAWRPSPSSSGRGSPRSARMRARGPSALGSTAGDAGPLRRRTGSGPWANGSVTSLESIGLLRRRWLQRRCGRCSVIRRSSSSCSRPRRGRSHRRRGVRGRGVRGLGAHPAADGDPDHPGGLGIIELGLTGALVAAGANDEVAAVAPLSAPHVAAVDPARRAGGAALAANASSRYYAGRAKAAFTPVG